MRRLLTIALALGLAAVVGAAAVDALRGGPGTPARPPAPASSRLPGGPELAGLLRRNGVRGTLYLSADGCLDGTVRRLRALQLPDLTLTEGPATRLCSVTVSPDGVDAASRPDAVWNPREPIFASATGDGDLGVIDVRGGELWLRASAPAFKPDGTLTHVRRGRVIAWSSACAGAAEILMPIVQLAPELVGPYCPRTAVARSELRRALREADRLRAVDALLWLDADRLLAVLRTDEGSYLAAFESGRSLGYANGLHGPTRTQPRASPLGEHVALSPGGFLEIYDRDAGRVWGSSLEALDHDWSPDGLWLAVAAPRRLVILRATDWTTLASLPFATESVAWRE